MIVVTIDMHPHGDTVGRRAIATITASLSELTDGGPSTYEVCAQVDDVYLGKREVLHRRSEGALVLVHRALEALLVQR